MEKEDQFFLVTQRDSLAYAAAGTRRAEKFQVHYTKLGAKKILSRKANTSPSDDGTLIEPNQFYQYCVVDEKDRLVKPKKITKKGKNLRIDINDAHFVELLDFFGRDKHKEGVTKFVSHFNRVTGNYEAINSVDGQLVELAPDHQDVAWCSRAGFIAAPEAAGHDIYVAEDLRYGQIYTLLPALPAPVAVAADEVAVAALPSLLPSFSPWVGGGAAAIALLSRGGGGAAAVPATPVPPVVADLVIHGHIMLGPLVVGTDLQVTAYDAAGNKLPSSTGNPITVTPNGTGGFDYAITVTGGYRGVVTVRLSNPGGNLDYVSEFTATQVNLGTGALLGSDNVPTSENEWIINITQATDLAARRILSAASADTDAPQLAAGVQAADVTDANIAVTNALLPSSAGTRITQLLPTSTIGADGKSSGDTSDYALLLHTLDVVAQQAAASASPLTLQQVQTNISKLLTWPNDGFKTATLQTQLPLLDTTKTDAANNVWVPSLAASFEQNENIATSYLATVKPADIPTNPATGQPYKVSYDITGGTDQALFDIDPNTGQITWKAAPDYEAPKDQGADNTYQVIVTAVTNAPLTSAYLSSSQVVTIKVNNVAETTVPPVVVPVTPTPPVVPPAVDLVIQGEGMFGPIVPGTDLVVTAYKSDGTELGRTTVVGTNATQYGYKYNYTITVPGAGGVGGYSGVVTVRLTNGGVYSDYISEGTGLAQNLADSGALLATDVVVPNGHLVTTTVNLKIINITQATDLAARKVLKPDTIDDLTKNPVVGTGVQTTDVNNANIAVTDALVPEYAGKKKSITQLTPTSTITATGTPSGDTSDYALLLHTMDVIVQNTTGTTEKLKTVQQNLSGLLTWTGYTIADLPSKLPLVDTTPDPVDTSKWPESSVVILAPNEGASLAYDVSVKPSAIPPGATVSYAITGGGDANKFELVDADPVNPKVNQKLLRLKADQALPDFDNPTDYGTDNTYDVIVTATTNIGLTVGYLSSSQVVKFSIGNLADTPPVFLDNTTPGTKIVDNTPLTVTVPSGTLAAYTPNVKFDDAADNKVYTLSGGVDASLFVIDATTGVVSFKDAADAPRVAVEWNADKTYTIEVTAEDTTVKTALVSPADPKRYQDTQTVNIIVQKLLTTETIDSFYISNAEISGQPNTGLVPSKLKYQDDTFVIKFTVTVSLTTDAAKKLYFVDEKTGAKVPVDLTDTTHATHATLSTDRKTLTITPSSSLNGDTNYHIEFDEGALRIGEQAVPALTGEDQGLDFSTQPPFTLHLAADATDLEVTSQIVLTTGADLDPIDTAVSGKTIKFTNLPDSGTKTGFSGENATHDFEIDAADTRYVNIIDGKVVIKPPFDFDFANHYQITVEAGAFSAAPDANGKVRSILAPETDANQPGALVFSTVNVATDFASIDSAVNTGYVMQDDGTRVAGKQWFAVDSTTAAKTIDLVVGNHYAMVFKDQNTDGHNPNVNDGVGVSGFTVTVNNFGGDDLVYADDQGNNEAKLNNSASTQIIDENLPSGDESLPSGVGPLRLEFDPGTNANDSRGTFILNGVDGKLKIDEVIKSLNISNTHKLLPTEVTGIERVDTPGVAGIQVLGAEITDTPSAETPLQIKISAAFEIDDTVELVYINDKGEIKAINESASSHKFTSAGTSVTLETTRAALSSKLPNQEGYNKIFAKLTNASGAVSYSDLLGGDNGVYLDTVAPVPTLTFATGSSATLTALDTDVSLVVQASHLKVGDTLVLKLGSTQIGSSVTVTALTASNDVVFTVPKTSLASGDNTLTVTSTDQAGNVGTRSVVVHNEFVTYSGAVGLGPVLDGNDLQVTAYDKNGVALDKATIDSLGTFALKINKTYTGAITLRVGNKTADTRVVDYRDEGQGVAGTDIDIGTGTIAAVVVADGNAKSVNVSTLTDLVARQLSVNNKVSDADALKISQYNLKLATLLGVPDPNNKGIIDITPTFVMDNTGAATLSAAGKYGQLLAQISDQAVAKGATLDAIQTQLSNAITWGWDGTAATATGDMAKQVLLLTQVAQAAALPNGSDASAYLTATDITSYLGTGPVSMLSAARKADLIARIVNSADDGSAFDTLTEVQALVDKVVALAKIQDYATLDTNPAPIVADYTLANLANVTADNLAAVNLRVLTSNAAGTSTDAFISAVVANGIQDQTDAVAKIVAFADDNTQPLPTLTDYVTAGVVGANADNLAAINTQMDAKAGTDVNTLAKAQGVVDAAITPYNEAIAVIRAYIRDSVANLAPDNSTFTNVGLPTLDTAGEIASAKYYLATVMVAADADLSCAAILGKLTAQQKALEKINAYAADSASPLGTPDATDYAAAGITGADASNLSILNNRVDAQSAIESVATLATLLNDVFAAPELLSIERAGTSVVNGAFQSDAYLNAAERTADQATFKVTFNRAVTGLTAANFDLTDDHGQAITGVTVHTVVTDDNGVGQVWLVTATDLAGLTNASTLRLNLANNDSVFDTTGLTTPKDKHQLTTKTYTAGQFYTVDTDNSIAIAPAAGEDNTLSISESNVHLYVSPATLKVGDTLTLFKVAANGTRLQLGSTVTVDAGHLNTGVTFTVDKTNADTSLSLDPGANTLRIQSTDVAGNIATGDTTINVSEYVQVSGTLGLPSPVLNTQDLVVTAYNTSGNVVGTGTVNANNTYTLQLLKAAGLVTLKLTSNSTSNDFHDEATNADTDFGHMVLSATFNATTAATQSANITLLTDLASRIITRTAASNASAVNKAITRLLIDGASNDEITDRAPDFAIDTTGTSTAGTATLYGQLFAQLSQQAKEKGKALDVVLEDFAAGITFDGLAATLDSAFAKEVVLLAKTQWAAAAGSSSHVTVQDLMDGGITGLSALPSDATWDARKANLITRIVATANDGNLVDTLTEVQALADKVLALGKIQDYADLGITAPTVADYAAAGYVVAGVPTVTADNLAAVNLRVLASDAAGTSTEAQVGSLVSTGAAAYTAAVANIKAYANTSNTSSNPQPTLADYVDAGITHVTDANLIAVNAKVHAAASAAADTTAHIQTLANEGIAAYADAITTHFIHDAALDTAGSVNSQIVLHFDGLFSGLPQVSDFSNFKVGQGDDAVDAALNSVAISNSDIQLILNLSAGAADAVVSFDYLQNLVPSQQITVAAGAAGAGGVADSFAFLMDKALNDNAALSGKAGMHNLIFGNGGSDTMTGAELSDTFVFGLGTTGTSTVTNFSFDQFDALDLSKLLNAYTGGSSNTHGTLSGFVKATTVNGGADLQLQIDKDGGGNFTSGLDATLQLTGAGTGLPASASTDLLNYMLKTDSLVL
jgi:hypothetical protein